MNHQKNGGRDIQHEAKHSNKISRISRPEVYWQ